MTTRKCAYGAMVKRTRDADHDPVQIFHVLVGWVVLSVPVTIVMGRVLRKVTATQVPGWTTSDEQQLARWRELSDR